LYVYYELGPSKI